MPQEFSLDKREPKTMRAMVARGRTVCIPDGNKTIVGYDPISGKPIERVTMRDYGDRKSTRLNSSHEFVSRMPSSA